MLGFTFSAPGFISGVGRVIDLGGTMTSPETLFTKDDGQAVYSDWAAVGSDLREAMGRVR